MTYEEWKKQTIEQIDSLVEEDMYYAMQKGHEWLDDDMLAAAADAIGYFLRGRDRAPTMGRQLYNALATDLAKGWIAKAYRTWYTGDIPQEENAARLVEWLTAKE